MLSCRAIILKCSKLPASHKKSHQFKIIYPVAILNYSTSIHNYETAIHRERRLLGHSFLRYNT